jgi:23S rRNA (guanosine2251-2'-O)-methyltransferase
MITLYGRMPVLEALLDPRATVFQVVVSRSAQGAAIDRIVEAARARGVKLERADPTRVTRISRNGRHDQGVVADVASPGLAELAPWLADHPGPLCLFLLDGLTNPANVGMIVRTAVGAGLDGVVLPRAGSPEISPLVVKASAGVALSAPVLRCATAAEAAATLARSGVQLIGLRAEAGTPLWELALPARAAFVLGNETDGVRLSPDAWCSIPMAADVASLNVAAAAAVVAFNVARVRASSP